MSRARTATWMRERVLVRGPLFGRFADGRITHWLVFNDLALLPA